MFSTISFVCIFVTYFVCVPHIFRYIVPYVKELYVFIVIGGFFVLHYFYKSRKLYLKKINLFCICISETAGIMLRLVLLL